MSSPVNHSHFNKPRVCPVLRRLLNFQWMPVQPFALLPSAGPQGSVMGSQEVPAEGQKQFWKATGDPPASRTGWRRELRLVWQLGDVERHRWLAHKRTHVHTHMHAIPLHSPQHHVITVWLWWFPRATLCSCLVC